MSFIYQPFSFVLQFQFLAELVTFFVPGCIIPNWSVTDCTITDYNVSDFTAADITAPDFAVPDFTVPDFTVPNFTAHWCWEQVPKSILTSNGRVNPPSITAL